MWMDNPGSRRAGVASLLTIVMVHIIFGPGYHI
jgi:hypothetical protein